jgi:tol-pal system protein YbgF
MILRWFVLALLATLSFQVLADDVAGRQIQQLQIQVDALDQRIGKLEALLRNQGLLAMLNEVETLKEEVAKLKGRTEVNSYQLESLGKRQTDLYQDLDHRLTDFANRPVSVPAPAKQAEVPQPVSPPTAITQPPVQPAPSQASPQQPAPSPAAPQQPVSNLASASGSDAADPLAESKQYEAALNQFRAANYVGAIAGFKGFAKTYPGSTLASNAQYWIAYSYYAMGDYKTAMAHQKKLLLEFPQSNKVPDAMLNIARCQEELKESSSAKKTLEEIIAKYSGTNAAAIAVKRLAMLK